MAILLTGTVGAGAFLGLHVLQQFQHAPSAVVTPSQTRQQALVTLPLQQVQTAATSTAPSITRQGSSLHFHGSGIQFSLDALDASGKAFAIKIKGSQILVGAASSIDQSHYHMEIFQKSPQDSFAAAITKAILSGYSSSNCVLHTYTNIPGYPSSYERAQILADDPTKCPVSYVTADNGRYFLYDASHPATFAFIEAGQMPLLNGDQPWDQSISFTN